MNRQGTSVFTNGLIWFGAAVSVAEIEAGIQSGKNWAALLLGHLLGGAMLFAIGLMGAQSRKNAMETTTSAFGKYGSKFFAILNLCQLLGWTSVMIAQGSAAISGLKLAVPSAITSAVIAALVACGVIVGLKSAARIGSIAMVLLVALVAVLSFKLFGNAESASATSHALPFLAAFELSVAMPLSWLPLISDYTKEAEKPVAATAASALAYTAMSIWMYAIGMAISTLGPEATLPSAILAMGLGIPGIVIILFSTVITTFFDAYSSGESAKTIWNKANSKIVGVVVCVLGVVLAVSGIMERYVNFLYLISSVFAPMAVVLLVSHYIVKKQARIWNLISWLAGFTVYQFAGNSPIGATITAMFIAGALALFGKLSKKAI